jgi:hypothetical protein
MADSTIQRTPAVSLEKPSRALSELLGHIPNPVLHEIAESTLQRTRATAAAVVLGHPEEWTCRASAGCFSCDAGATCDAVVALADISASKATVEWCGNAQMDARLNPDLCRELGVSSILIAPLFREENLIGFVEAFSRRPYTFGVRDLQALEALAEKYSRSSWDSGFSPNADAHIALASGAPRERKKRYQPGLTTRIILWAGAVVVLISFLVGLWLGWRLRAPRH